MNEPTLDGWVEPLLLQPVSGSEVMGEFQVEGIAPGVESVRLIIDRVGVLEVPVAGDRFRAALSPPATPGTFVLEVAGLLAGVEVVRSRPSLLRAGQSPFTFLSSPAERGECAMPWQYDDDNQPEVTPNEAVRWAWVPLPDLPAPSRLVVEAETGAVRWTPRSSDVGRVGFELLAENGRGRARQRVEVLVDCTLAVGCQSTGASVPLLVAVMALLLCRSRLCHR